VADAVSSGCCLAVALGGGSDCIGALALARALGYEDVVLVMPSGGKSGGSQVLCEPVSAAEAPALPPGGDFYSNDTMLAYLLSLPIGLRPTVAKFLVQPKDAAGAKSFSLASLNATTDALLALARTHQCTAIAGLDFGGDVVLPEPLLDDFKRRLEQQPQPLSQPNMDQSADSAVVPSAAERVGAVAGRGVKRAAEDEPEGGAPSVRAREDDPVSADPVSTDQESLIKQRDTLNLHAVGAVARKLGVPATLVASAPGVDAAAVAPEYARRLGGPGGATVPVFAMGADEANPCSLAPVPGPAPPCSLPELPEALTRARMPAPVEAAFVHELRRLAERIAYDARAQLQLQREHAYKTYSLVAACAAKLEASGALPGALVKDAPSSASDGGDFFVLGAFWPSEKARAHMHASTVLGLFDVAGWVWEWGGPLGS
jgi:hypothetical protein